MFDIAPTELMLCALVALLVIGPKDLPRAMRVVGHWVGKARGVARHFRSGMDEMIRQSELEDMEKRWAAENERIMRDHPLHAYNAAAERDAAAGIAPGAGTVVPGEDEPPLDPAGEPDPHPAGYADEGRPRP